MSFGDMCESIPMLETRHRAGIEQNALNGNTTAGRESDADPALCDVLM